MSDNTEKKTTVVKADSKAYGYNYASLADIAKQGFEIPKMRSVVIEGLEYIEYLDDIGEWQQGARIVIPEMKGMNAAQAYGSALTYARRYTAQMALALASDDDAKMERTDKEANGSAKGKDLPPSSKQLGLLRRMLTAKGLNEEQINVKLGDIKTMNQASMAISKMKELEG